MSRGFCILILAVTAMTGWAGLKDARSEETDPFAEQRAAMIKTIQGHAASTYSTILSAEISVPVLEAMGRLARHEFVPEDARLQAYQDRPLPIGYGQTISQPYIVALMSDLLNLEPGATVLEVGTGSGYQAAVLAEMGMAVHTIEIIPELGQRAAAAFKRLGFKSIKARTGDGYYGWKESAPFDGVVVTAAASHIPPPLIQQLKPGGRMIIPVGRWFEVQILMLVTKNKDGTVETRQLLPVAFVPLTGEH